MKRGKPSSEKLKFGRGTIEEEMNSNIDVKNIDK